MIWIVGNKGMLGSELCDLLTANKQEFLASDRELNILDTEGLRQFSKDKNLHWIINCAAYTAVDKAEDEEELALRLNAEGPANLAQIARDCKARLIHISTDYVFSGTGSQPYTEDNPMQPLGAYGRTKAEGERRVLALAPDALIVRTAWLYGKHGPNFVYTMLRLMKERESLGVVVDQQGSPTWARDLARALLALIEQVSVPGGVYHCTNEGQTTWHEFAQAIQHYGLEFGLLENACIINGLRTDQYPTKAKRPQYSVLSKEKIKSLGIAVPDWRESLQAFLRDL